MYRSLLLKILNKEDKEQKIYIKTDSKWIFFLVIITERLSVYF